LAKDPEERWQTGRDLAQELKWVAKAERVAAAQETKLTRLIRGPTFAWTLAVASLALAAVALWAPWRVNRPDANPVAHLTMAVAPAEMLGPVRNSSRPVYTAVAIPPDGDTVVFAGIRGSPPQTQLYKRAIDQSAATAIPGTEAAAEPFFS